VQEKNIAFPTDAKLYNKARLLLVKLSQKEGIELRQNYNQVAKKYLLKISRYGHAKQYKRMRNFVGKMKTILGRIIRDIERKAKDLSPRFKFALSLSTKLYNQKKNDKNKIYSLHAPEVQCIAKGKAGKKYEFGNKVSLSTTARSSWIVGVNSFRDNIFDGKTVSDSLFQTKDMIGHWPKEAYVDQGYKGYSGHIFGTQVYIQGKKRYPDSVKRWLRRRSRIEPIIGHLKSDHRMGRNFLNGSFGDGINAILAAVAFNLVKCVRCLKKRYFLAFLLKFDLFFSQKYRANTTLGTWVLRKLIFQTRLGIRYLYI